MHIAKVQYAIAKDTISSRALQEKPDLGREKLTWLQRHDQVRRVIWGFALVRGHASDGNRPPGPPQRHTEGMISQDQKTHIWNQPPTCIFVQFTTKTQWRVQGLDKDNVFPVTLQRQPWHIDKGRSRPMLRVVRRQFPLAPGFATTAHAAQGQTYAEGAMTDMQIGEGGGPMTAYIAVTRVRDREGLYNPLMPRHTRKDVAWGGLCCCRPGVGTASIGQRTRYREEEEACSQCRERKPKSGSVHCRAVETGSSRAGVQRMRA